MKEPDSETTPTESNEAATCSERPAPDDVQSESGHRGLVSRITHLPPAVGIVLMGIGAAGLVIPGPFGTPFLLAGGLVLAPRMFKPVDRAVQRRFPNFYGSGMKVVARFLSDMEKRFPSRPPEAE